ncbi:type II toxin-antitoxin system VapC family toxin [Kerstersia gyiorum]|uniref:type II toxin-antitoxin system VapC family toxin n=1 Tax=Kerstersia gyiorum TaxID=206506 RepID=UPI00102C22A8|nr:type II toxin-antitoxin system VapC family toxin [Kerstersia gyiorum]KAB0544159.1 type II toxin-antitoxin system VapC family toxin [Kerstersia gyiorum]
MLDSSFLICLSNDERPEHQTAKKYYAEFIQRGIPMYLSTIVICEYEVRQRITDFGLENFLVQPFNIDEAIQGARVFDHLFSARGQGDERVSVKDDAKILSQCILGGISHFITSDTKCANRVTRLRSAATVSGLPMPIDVQQPYCSAWFNPENQAAMDFE